MIEISCLFSTFKLMIGVGKFVLLNSIDQRKLVIIDELRLFIIFGITVTGVIIWLVVIFLAPQSCKT